MAVAIKPLRRRRRTAQRGKSLSQSQRWGKVVTTMPVPEGNITTSEILVPVEPVDAFAEINNAELAAYDAAMADALEKAKNDLPELS